MVYLARKGAAGIIDISPFTCMNGIVCEAIYPRISRDLGGLPIRNFYFDGTQSDLDRDLGVYMELARSFARRAESQRLSGRYVFLKKRSKALRASSALRGAGGPHSWTGRRDGGARRRCRREPRSRAA